MKPLLNALAFAAIVIAAVAMDSNLPQRVASSPLLARVEQHVEQHLRPEAPQAVGIENMQPGFVAGINQAEMDRAMQRAEAARQRLDRINLRQVEMRVRLAQRPAAALNNCKVIRIDQ